jgi:hypothetical protein
LETDLIRVGDMPHRSERLQITIDIPDDTAQLIEEYLAYYGKSECSSHGPLTLQRLMTMLVEDLELSITKNGSWQGSNMQSVLRAHGYPW